MAEYGSEISEKARRVINEIWELEFDILSKTDIFEIIDNLQSEQMEPSEEESNYPVVIILQNAMNDLRKLIENEQLSNL